MKERIKKTLDFIIGKTSFRPEILIILGSGFGKIADKIDIEANLHYGDIPYFKKTHAPTHEGNLIFGNFSGKKAMIMQGRPHIYEGYDANDVVYPIMVASRLGARRLITTNLSGGINKDFKVGDFMVVEDHINFSCENPLIGFKSKKGEVPFVDMLNAYSPELSRLLQKTALMLKIKLRKGVLAYLTGPNFETPSELRFLRMAGADVIGWSIVPEVLMARHAGMEVLGICCISDLSNPDELRPINLTDIFNVGLRKTEELHRLLAKFLDKLE